MAIASFGSDLKKGNTADYSTVTAWTSVGCITEINPPSATVDDIAVPVCVNATSRAKTYLPGGYDPGEASYTILFEDGDVDDAIAALGVTGAWLIKLGTSGKALVFNGYFKGFSLPTLTEEGFISLSCTLKISGDMDEITYTG